MREKIEWNSKNKKQVRIAKKGIIPRNCPFWFLNTWEIIYSAMEDQHMMCWFVTKTNDKLSILSSIIRWDLLLRAFSSRVL